MKRFKWCYLLILPAAILAFVFASRAYSDVRFKAGPIGQHKQTAGDVHYTKLVVAGDPVEKGIYDPSVAYSPDGCVGWLAYSSVKGSGNLIRGRFSLGQYVHTHLARTTNGGADWEFMKVLNKSADATLTSSDGKKLSGVWRYEVPTLVFDPTDPDSTRRWKLFVHRYFWNAKHDRMVNYGWIALRTAADPAGEWSAEVPLFGAGKSPVAPHHDTRVDLNTLDASLKNAAAYSEPGALANDGRLYLSMTALLPRLGLTGVSVGHTIVLLASDDHGTTWRFVRKLLDDDIADRMGCELFDGSSLAREDGRFFLFAVPGHRGTMHDGTAVFEFESLTEGRLRLGTNGLPVVTEYYAPQPGIFSGPGAGQACYDEHNTRGGLIMPQFNLRAYPEVFQIYQTGRRITPQP